MLFRSISLLVKFSQEMGDEGDPRDFTPELIREWIVSLMDAGYTASSVNRKLSALRSFYKYLLKKEHVQLNPMAKIVAPKKAKPLPYFLKESEMDRLLDETDYGEGFQAVRDRLIIEMLYSTGMRSSELVGLADVDVDFSGSILKVTGKRNKQRLIPFGEALKNSMQYYVDLRKVEIGEGSGAFFVRKDGTSLTRDQVYKIVKRNLSKVVTLKKRSPHVLRHTFATTMLNNDAELCAVKELLGHESLSATEVYTHTTFEELIHVYQQAHPLP